MGFIVNVISPLVFSFSIWFRKNLVDIILVKKEREFGRYYNVFCFFFVCQFDCYILFTFLLGA